MNSTDTRSSSIVLDHDRESVHDNDTFELPIRWCFGLSHPYIQQLIMKAGILHIEVDDEADNST